MFPSHDRGGWDLSDFAEIVSASEHRLRAEIRDIIGDVSNLLEMSEDDIIEAFPQIAQDPQQLSLLYDILDRTEAIEEGLPIGDPFPADAWTYIQTQLEHLEDLLEKAISQGNIDAVQAISDQISSLEGKTQEQWDQIRDLELRFPVTISIAKVVVLSNSRSCPASLAYIRF